MAGRTAEARTVYLETTIVSYLTARPSRDIIILGRQELTRQWWEEDRHRYALFISPFVVGEAEEGDPTAAARRLQLLAEARLLDPQPEIEYLAGTVRKELRIPTKARLDGVHVAYGIYYELDYILTWNCAHLANADSLRRLADFCRHEGLWLPIVCTPEEMTTQRRFR